MGKSTHFIGQPLLLQVLNYVDKGKVLSISRRHGGERYVKSFDCWQHLVVMLYSVLMRFDSLREIMLGMKAEARKLLHLGITKMPRRSTLSDANMRRSSSIFEDIYGYLYHMHREKLLADSRPSNVVQWLNRLRVIDSTTITMFSNIIFKGAGRNPRHGKKKCGIKVHKDVYANEGVAGDNRNAIEIQIWVTHDSKLAAHAHAEVAQEVVELLKPCNCSKNHAHVLCGLQQLLRIPKKGLAECIVSRCKVSSDA